jgi:hypothetical protein
MGTGVRVIALDAVVRSDIHTVEGMQRLLARRVGQRAGLVAGVTLILGSKRSPSCDRFAPDPLSEGLRQRESSATGSQ